MSARSNASILVAMACAAALSVAGCSGSSSKNSVAGSVESVAGGTISSLQKGVPGLSQAQAALGAGSLMGLAKNKMPADQFSQVASAVPGTQELIGQATSAGLPANVSSLSQVSSFLGKHGVSPSQLNQLVPVLGNEVSTHLSPDVATAFQSALK